MTFSPVVLGIDFGGTKIATAVSDLAGWRLASRTVAAAADAQGAFARGGPARRGATITLDRGSEAGVFPFDLVVSTMIFDEDTSGSRGSGGRRPVIRPTDEEGQDETVERGSVPGLGVRGRRARGCLR